MQKIISRDNAKLKLARRVRDGRAADLIFIEGLRLAQEACRSRLTIREALISEKFDDERAIALLSDVSESGTPVSILPEDIFSSVADTKTSQGVVLLADRPDSSENTFRLSLTAMVSKQPLIVLLHEINNPSNLGAIMRTAEAAGCVGVIVSQHSADVYSPKSLRASMGAAFRLKTWTGGDLAEILKMAGEIGLRSVAADVGATNSYDKVDWKMPRLVVFGSEAHGLEQAELDLIDETLVIPMANDVESLNLAVAAGIILFEAKRHRQS